MSDQVADSFTSSLEKPGTARLQDVMRKKEYAHTWVRGIETIWDFYFEVFGQRQSRFAKWLLSCDRIALDCYRTSYLGLAVARSIPAPPPFSYVATGFSPATFRRGTPLKRLGKQLNPFPLIQLPYHRLVNPWTLGGVLHEVSHNLQNDLSLARGPEATLYYSGRGPHPTPYLRMLINAELPRRMGFETESRQIRKAWMRIYPNPSSGNMPVELLKTFNEACRVAVDAICYQPDESLGNRSLAKVLNFGPKEEQMIEEASRRLAAGTDPGIIPERFLIGAVRLALDRRHARPEVLTTNFYKALASG
jgi:hypothetical protein